jgi:hypothetical protein
MNPLENCLLLAGLPLGMLLAGYWLAAGLRNAAASERLATAVLAGLSVLLWNVATVNFFKPLSGAWAWLCLWPVLATLLYRGAITLLWRDLVTVLANKRGMVAAILGVGFLTLLLWPLLSRPELVFYDGTSNHDAFFWISGAENLKRHTYMEMPVNSQVHPFYNTSRAIIGWRADWGRMGGEGLLALTSSLVGLAPVKLYLAATATLIVPWIAAVFLVVRTFLVRRLGLAATLGLVVLQPVFVFFYGNANLPNLIGALTGATAVVATQQALQATERRWIWLLLLAFAFHGLLCSYPEMVPFVLLPAGLLWLHAWFTKSPRLVWRAAIAVSAAWIVGALINPPSTVRAWYGFIASYEAGRANKNWANLFEPLSIAEHIPALATLSVIASKSIGPVLGALLSVILLIGIFLALRRAKDRLCALFTLAGSIALLVYTFTTGFMYGLQKTVQFGGALWAAFLPIAIIDAFARTTPAAKRAAYLSRAALVSVLALFSYATVVNCLDGHNWSHRKILTQDWFDVREYARDHLAGAPVLVDGATFRMAFFHGMWASYFLLDSDMYFAARGEENGGYLRDSIINEARSAIPAPSAYLVSRDWADTFDANSERLVLGDTVALLKNANRVSKSDGMQPDNGVPDNVEAHVMVEVTPHSRSQLKLTLSPRYPGKGAAESSWAVTSQVNGKDVFSATFGGPPPWNIVVPLTPGQLNHIEFSAGPTPPPNRLPPFMVREIKIEAAHD